MHPPEFWWRNNFASRVMASALAPIARVYGTSVARKHAMQNPYRANVPVVCVGNLTVGGTGKTPVAIAIAQLLHERSLAPVFLLRGYGRKTNTALVADAESHDTTTVGDEALLLARVAPTVVSADRAHGAGIAEALEAQAIVMDDGHQNFSVAKDLSLVVVDGETGFGNGRIVPAGPLREPLEEGLRRADAVIVMGDGDPALPGFAKPVLRARLAAAHRQEGRRVVAFAGIGRPGKFFASLRETGNVVVETHAFGDHHVYSGAEIARLKRRAAKANATLITTEKDLVRLAPNEREGVAVLPVRAVFDDPAALVQLLQPVFSRAAPPQ